MRPFVWPHQLPPGEQPTREALVAAEQRRQLARRSQAIGTNAQEIVGHRLRQHGVRCLWRIHTGTKGRGKARRFASKVEGDWRGTLAPSGRSLLCEVKARADVLALHDFEMHQADALNQHLEAGAVALVAWVRGTEVAFLDWPLAGLEKGKPLHWEQAQLLALRCKFLLTRTTKDT